MVEAVALGRRPSILPQASNDALELVRAVKGRMGIWKSGYHYIRPASRQLSCIGRIASRSDRRSRSRAIPPAEAVHACNQKHGEAFGSPPQPQPASRANGNLGHETQHALSSLYEPDRRSPCRGSSVTSREYPTTPDGRYFIVAGRLWRSTNPAITEQRRRELVDALMDARRAVKNAKRGQGDLDVARSAVDAAKVALGERGPVWWSDGAPDLNRHLAKNTTYAAWAAVHDCKRKRNPT